MANLKFYIGWLRQYTFFEEIRNFVRPKYDTNKKCNDKCEKFYK